jgi:hypothetical protein
MQYAANDERNNDIAGRLAYLQTIADDADKIAHMLEKRARGTADPALAGSLHRLSVVARDFCTNATNAFSAASPALKSWLGKN